MVATRSLHALACRGVTSPYVSEFQDPLTCQDPFMVTDRRIVSANEGRRLQRHGSHMCAFPRGQEKKEMDQAARRARLQRPRIGTIQNGRGASLDRAVAHDRARRPWHHLRSATGIAKGQAVELEARSSGSPQIVQSSSSAIARRSSLRLAAPCNARLPDFGRTASPEIARRKTHWGVKSLSNFFFQ